MAKSFKDINYVKDFINRTNKMYLYGLLLIFKTKLSLSYDTFLYIF